MVYEDVALLCRARLFGARCMCAPHVRVRHAGNTSFAHVLSRVVFEEHPSARTGDLRPDTLLRQTREITIHHHELDETVETDAAFHPSTCLAFGESPICRWLG